MSQLIAGETENGWTLMNRVSFAENRVLFFFLFFISVFILIVCVCVCSFLEGCGTFNRKERVSYVLMDVL